MINPIPHPNLSTIAQTLSSSEADVLQLFEQL